MTDSSPDLLRRFLALAAQHPDGPQLLRAFNRTFQFDLVDGDPFFVRIENGTLSVEEGDCGLDWKYRDWDRVTCVRTSRAVLENVVSGRSALAETFFNQEMGFAPNRAADPRTGGAAVVAWLYSIFRLAQEQIEKQARQRQLQEIIGR